MPAILFVCRANQFRSPIAAACFERKLSSLNWKGEWVIDSAGTWASDGLVVAPMPRQVASQLGLSIETHISNLITAEMIEKFDLILVMEDGQKEALHAEFPDAQERILMLTELVTNQTYNIIDPDGESHEFSLALAEEICRLVEDGFFRIVTQALTNNRQRLASSHPTKREPL